jgi:hypothetical protein
MKHYSALMLVLFVLAGCGAPAPTPDAVASQVAVLEAAAATLTAKAPAPANTPPATSTPRPHAPAALGTLGVPILTAQPLLTAEIPYPKVPRISLEEAKGKLDSGQAVLIDVRSKESYDQAHAGGALSIPEEKMDARLSELPRDQLLILYCT